MCTQTQGCMCARVRASLGAVLAGRLTATASVLSRAPPVNGERTAFASRCPISHLTLLHSSLGCILHPEAGGGGGPTADETRVAGKVEIRSTKGRSSEALCLINVANLVCCCFVMNYSGLRSTEVSTNVNPTPNNKLHDALTI